MKTENDLISIKDIVKIAEYVVSYADDEMLDLTTSVYNSPKIKIVCNCETGSQTIKLSINKKDIKHVCKGKKTKKCSLIIPAYNSMNLNSLMINGHGNCYSINESPTEKNIAEIKYDITKELSDKKKQDIDIYFDISAYDEIELMPNNELYVILE